MEATHLPTPAGTTVTTLFTESISPKLTGGYSMVIRCAAFFGNCCVHHTAVDFARANRAAVDNAVADSLLKQSNHG